MAPGKNKLSPAKRPREGETRVKQTTLDFHNTAVEGRTTRAGSKAVAEVAVVRGLARRGLAGPQAAAEKRLTCRALAPDKPAAPQPQKLKGSISPAKKPTAAKPKAAAGKAGQAQRAGGSKVKREVLVEVERDDEVFRAGDVVYVVLDENMELGGEAEEPCCVRCGREEKEEVVMLECDSCLCGWHLGCLTPPLEDVPEGIWLCPNCSAGEAPPPRAATCAHEKFLQQQGLGLALIEALWREECGEECCMLRWYYLPEETHRGRQKHRPAREVFLTQLRTQESVDSLLLGCCPKVLAEQDFFSGGAAQGEDVFLCEYEYDTLWQRFRHRTKFDSEGEEDWGPSDEDEQEEEGRDKTFKPNDALRVEKGMAPAKNARGRRKKVQGGDALLDRVGALEIHDQARRRRGQEGAGPSCQLARARDMLMLTAVPASLPCRDKERREVEAFVQDVLDNSDATGCGKCLYVSGIPGTGKTATVLEVMRGFRRRAVEGSAPRFQFVEINGLRLPSPQHAYSALYEAMTGDRVGPQAAVQLLDDMMGSSGSKAARQHTIVLVDEMDMLVNKTQTVLYNLFDWPGRKGSKLSIIGVANTMDLPQRLHPRIGSRLAGRSVVFHPYTNSQLQQIIESRLDGLPAFDAAAVKMVSLKVANCSGDVRRCLELCRRAAEIAEERWVQQQKKRQQQEQQHGGASTSGSSSSSGATGSIGLQQEREETGVVEMRHVNTAVQEMFNTAHVIMIRTASRLERLLLAALHTETRRTGRADSVLEDVAERLKIMCQNNMERQYEFGAVLDTAVRLGSKRLILCDPGVKRLKMKLSLNVPVNDLLHVLRNDDQITWLAERLVD